MEVENDRLIYREQRVKVRIRQSVRMFCTGLHLEKIDNVNETNLDVREFLSQQHGCGERLLRGYVPCTCHHDVRFDTLVINRPIPNDDTLGEVFNGGIYIQVMKMHVLIGVHQVTLVLLYSALVR